MIAYTIIGGVNGAGKSSLTGVLKNQLRDLGVIVDVDKITAQLGGNPMDGGKAALKKIGECLERGVSFTQETTLSGFTTERTIRSAKEKGYYVRLFYVGLDTAEESIKRIKNRVSKGGHDIPDDDVLRRFDGRFEALSQILPYCEEVTFFDNDNGFVEVAEYRNGEIVPKGSKQPQWLVDLVAYMEQV